MNLNSQICSAGCVHCPPCTVTVDCLKISVNGDKSTAVGQVRGQLI